MYSSTLQSTRIIVNNKKHFKAAFIQKKKLRNNFILKNMHAQSIQKGEAQIFFEIYYQGTPYF